MHDVAGICRWQGKYHLFYLISPPDMRWARGHAVSDDMVYWRDLPMLPKEYQAGTGQAWAEKDRVILSLASGKLLIASDPMVTNWTEHPVKSPSGDNTFWHEGDYYYSAVTGGNTLLDIHRTKDLTQWEKMGKYLEDSFHTEPGTDCACPNVLPLGGGKHIILFFSHNQGPKYDTGISDLQNGRFKIEKHGRMNYGPVGRGSLHAPSGFVDTDGRCIGVWNITECMISDNFQGTKGQIMSLPRRLSLNPVKTADEGFNIRELNPLAIEPIEQLKALRFDPVKVENLTIPANGEQKLDGVQGRAMELEVVLGFSPSTASVVCRCVSTRMRKASASSLKPEVAWRE